MKGKTKIEIFNENGKLKKVYEKENMITNLLNNLFSNNLPSFIDMYSDYKLNRINNFTPIINNTIGGILLFDSHLVEDVEHIIPTAEDFSKFVGNAGGIFSGVSETRGTLNLNESTEIENGYRFVWDWKSGQAMTINSLALTSKDGGDAGLYKTDTTATTIMTGASSKLNINKGLNTKFGEGSSLFPYININNDGVLVHISEDLKNYICINTISNNSCMLNKFTLRDNISLSDNIEVITNTNKYSNLDELSNITKYSQTISTSRRLMNARYMFADKDYIYSLYSSISNNTELTINYIRINPSDFYVVEKDINITLNKSMSSSTIRPMIIKNDKIYMTDNTNNLLYIIDINTETIQEVIDIPISGTYIPVLFNEFIMLQHFNTGNVSLTKHCYILDSNNVLRYNNILYNSAGYYGFFPVFDYLPKPFFLSRCYHNNILSTINMNLLNIYFVSINNLDTTIEKGTQDTLKITYEITN